MCVVAIVALQRMIAGRMAVHAARMGDHLGDLVEQRARALGLVADPGERGERAQVARVERGGVLNLRRHHGRDACGAERAEKYAIA